jgi:hypothetical protein
MTTRRLILLMVVMPFLAAAIVGGTGVWFTDDFRLIGLAGLVMAIAGGALVVASGQLIP